MWVIITKNHQKSNILYELKSNQSCSQCCSMIQRRNHAVFPSYFSEDPQLRKYWCTGWNLSLPKINFLPKTYNFLITFKQQSNPQRSTSKMSINPPWMSQQASLSQLTFGMDEDSLLIERMCDVIESSDSDGGTRRAMPRLFASPSYIMTSLLSMLGKHGWCVFKGRTNIT